MTFTPINIETWQRKEYYLHYRNHRCTYSLTANIDITKLKQELKKRNQKIYPALIYMITTIVNQQKEFRMSKNDSQELGYWDTMIPSYTILNQNQTFSSIWTEYTTSFSEFYTACTQDIATYANLNTFSPKPHEPLNTFNISSVPWIDFTSFHLNIYDEGEYLLPIFTIGKFIYADDKVFMPLAIQVNHAVCDGFHVGQWLTKLQQFADKYPDWID
ncbi:type A chloramphenicol O-acetyltransferase [Enterococcus saccharolyticus]|uniref:type A chloramphenicol O-acetyltransferase n=1 Tax=Enterococcus saccharolyticus TaxID=41997 RepID=UPI0039DFBE9D